MGPGSYKNFMAVCDNMTPSPLEESRHTGCVRGGVSLVGDGGTTPRRADQNQVRGSVTWGLHHSAGDRVVPDVRPCSQAKSVYLFSVVATIRRII